MPILGQNGQVINPNQVPVVGQSEQAFPLMVTVLITPELKKKLIFYSNKRGITGQALVLEIVMRGLGSLGAEVPLPERYIGREIVMREGISMHQTFSPSKFCVGHTIIVPR